MDDEIEDTLEECLALVGRLADIFEDPDVIELRRKISRAIEARKLEKGLGGE